MNTFFTSDTHFGHTNIAGPTVSKWPSGYRTFNSTQEMNETIIKNWNEKITPEDQVYHLGDFAFGDALKFKRRLNGTIYLIKGNHEKPALAIRDEFGWVKDVAEIKVNNQTIFLSHYAHRVWNKSHHSVFHLYGHSHGSLPDDPNALSMDVGIDTNNYYPYSFDDIKRAMDKKTFVAQDHHTGRSFNKDGTPLESGRH